MTYLHDNFSNEKIMDFIVPGVRWIWNKMRTMRDDYDFDQHGMVNHWMG